MLPDPESGLKTLAFVAVWDYYCRHHSIPVRMLFNDEVRRQPQVPAQRTTE